MSPPLRGVLRQEAVDFQVEEIPGFQADGQGEHDLLWVEKAGANTAWVATQLARHAGVAPVAVGYSGLKDRHALTWQHFSVQLPGRQVDWSGLRLPGVRVLEVQRHSRKLQRGAHRGNHFRIMLHELSGDTIAAETLLQRAAREGVPNHFGEQRFGNQAGNIQLVQRLANGARLDRTQRGFALSTARALIFNAVLDARVQRGDWQQLQAGDLAQLDGSGSVFGPVQPDPQLHSRCEQLDIHPTGPLWGRGSSPCTDAVATLEQQIADTLPQAVAVCASAGMKHERRALRMRVQALRWHWPDPSSLSLEFTLGRGCFATALLAGLLQASDAR